MTHVDTWGEWIVWPLRKIFNLRAERAEFRAEVHGAEWGMGGTGRDMSRADAVAWVRRSRRMHKELDQRNAISPQAAFVLEMLTEDNAAALARRKAERGSKPTTIQVYERGEFRDLVISPDLSAHSAEPAQTPTPPRLAK